MEPFNCDLCGSEEYVVLWDKTEREKIGVLRSVVIRDKEGNIVHGRNVMCKRCGLVQVYPRMSKEELDRFYANDYRNIYGGDRSFSSEIRHSDTAYRLMPKKEKHLDIGCSTGKLLKMTNGFGIEPNIEHYEKAIKDGLRVANCTIEELDEYEKYDIITMLNALEHVISPTDVLIKIHNLLNDDGHVLISVPNLINTHINIPVDAFLSNAHLFNFTPFTLGIMAQKCGLKPVKMLSISEEMGKKIYMLAKKSEPVEVEFDDNIEKRIEFTKMFLEYVDRVFVMDVILNGGIKISGNTGSC